MQTDAQGNPLPGANAEAAHHYDEAVRAFNLYRGNPLALLHAAAHEAPDFAMAPIARAHMLVASSEPAAMQEAREVVSGLTGRKLDERERSHVGALVMLAQGEWTQGARLLELHSARYPRDLLALQAGHLVDFYTANARSLRDRVARALPAWSPDLPGFAVVVGMHSFGLEECGAYDRAEEEGRRAVALEPFDCWAHHAVTHVMEMQGRAEDGIGWMIAREPYWSAEDNGFKVHNWWHRALFHLDLGQLDEAAALYDGPMRETRSTVALDLVDASALLWRLSMAGFDTGDRWAELADTWAPHADGGNYPFNDVHAVMAYLGADRNAELARVTEALAKNAARDTEPGRWARDYGLPLVEGLIAFWRGDHARAVDKLMPARNIANAFGGSHAQRDVFDWTLTEAAIRGDMKPLARALVNERLARKPRSLRNREFAVRVAGLKCA